MNSREKGKRGERLWRDFLKSYGLEARRGQQYSGGDDSPDVVCKEMDEWFHTEVKFVEKLNLYEALQQSQRDCGDWSEERIPIVAHKKSRQSWMVTMDANSFMQMVSCLLSRAESTVITRPTKSGVAK